jgi:hypothetical protein
MASVTLPTAVIKFLKNLLSPPNNEAALTDPEQSSLRTLLNAASHTATETALGTKQDHSDALDAYADAEGENAAAIAAARRALINAASDDSPNFNSPTALTATVGDRSSLLATTEFVWDGGPLKAIPPDGVNPGSLLAQYNNTTTANTLGYGAVDLQSTRSAGTQTAAGNFSFISGGNGNTASGVGSHAQGYYTVAIGNYSHSEGSYTTASGHYSHAQGANTIASGQNSHAQGSSSTASGACSHAEGSSNTASGHYSHAGGSGNTARFFGQVTYGAANDDSQYSRIDLHKRTSDATPTILLLGNDGVSNRKLTILSGYSMAGTVNILGIQATTGVVAAHYIRKFAIKNVGGTTSLIGTITALGTDYESEAGLDVAITANDTDDSLDITVTGKSATDIRWAAVVDAVEVKLT